MFGPLGGPELLLILVVALIVFGPRKLPEIGKSMGKMMVEFRRASNEFKRTIETEVTTERNRGGAAGTGASATPASLPASAVPGVGATLEEASGSSPAAESGDADSKDAAPEGSVAREPATPAASDPPPESP